MQARPSSNTSVPITRKASPTSTSTVVGLASWITNTVLSIAKLTADEDEATDDDEDTFVYGLMISRD